MDMDTSKWTDADWRKWAIEMVIFAEFTANDDAFYVIDMADRLLSFVREGKEKAV